MILKLSMLALSLLIFMAYTIYIIRKFGVQPSLSDSFYDLGKYRQYLFTFFILGSSVPLMVAANATFMYIAGGLICLVGLAPAYKETKLESTMHVIGATGGYAVAFLSLIIDFKLWPLAIIAAILAATIKKNSKNYTWYAENIGYFSLWTGVLAYVLM